MTSPTLAQVNNQNLEVKKVAQLDQPVSAEMTDFFIKPRFNINSLPLEPNNVTFSLTPSDINVQNEGELTPFESNSDHEGKNLTEQPIFLEPVRQGQGVEVPPSLFQGAVIDRVFIYLGNPTSDTTKNEQYQQQIAQSFQIRAGGSFSSLFSDLSLRRVQQLPFVAKAEYRLYEGDSSGRVILALLVTLQTEETEIIPKKQGILVNGDFRQFPTLYESDRTLVNVIFNGGFGVFSDTNPWFGNSEDFVAGDYQPKGTMTWPEFYVETGIGGITQIKDSPFYLYGAVSYLESSTLAPDIFRADTRFYDDIEKLYGGFLIAKKGLPVSFNFSAGRQPFQLNGNFLFGQVLGSANALERGSSFLTARTAYDNTILGNLRIGNFLIQGFYLDPDELPISETNSRFLGVNAKYNDNRHLEASLAYITVPESDTIYVLPDGQQETRQGLQVINPRIRLTNLFGVKGFWVESEYAYEWNSHYAMNAQAGYIWASYTFLDATWTPSISYRFAGFSGDNPNTNTYERFDSLRGGGLGDWLQGINLGKVYGNSNVLSHRVEFKINPTNQWQLSLDYFYLFSDELNNLGGRPVFANLQSHSIGQELMLTSRWSVSRNLFLLGVGSIAFPGEAIKKAVTNDTQPWITLQLSLFLGF